MAVKLLSNGRLRLALKLFPRSRQDGIDGMHDGRVHLKLSAPAVDGKANAAMVVFLARLLGVRKTQIFLVSGEKARQKIVEIEGISLDEARQRMGLSESL